MTLVTDYPASKNEILVVVNDYRCYALTVILLSAAPVALAQADKIQVYDGEIAGRGVFNLMIHTNFTLIGRKPSTTEQPVPRSLGREGS